MHRLVLPLGLLLCVPGCGKRKELEAELARVEGELEASEKENQSLKQRITVLEGELTEVKAQLDDLAQKAGTTAEELERLRAEKRKRDEELKVYKRLFAKLKKLIDAGTIQVTFRKGRMVLKLASAILFDSGKIKLKPAGQVALNELVAALKSVPDRDFLVAGHTDNIPIKTKRYRSNWDLSTARAVVVVNYMIEQGFPGVNIGAAGYGEYDPVANNENPDGRAENRRIEVVLMPNLGEIEGIRQALEAG